jgi:hypothetical protein
MIYDTVERGERWRQPRVLVLGPAGPSTNTTCHARVLRARGVCEVHTVHTDCDCTYARCTMGDGRWVHHAYRSSIEAAIGHGTWNGRGPEGRGGRSWLVLAGRGCVRRAAGGRVLHVLWGGGGADEDRFMVHLIQETYMVHTTHDTVVRLSALSCLVQFCFAHAPGPPPSRSLPPRGNNYTDVFKPALPLFLFHPAAQGHGGSRAMAATPRHTSRNFSRFSRRAAPQPCRLQAAVRVAGEAAIRAGV